MCFMGWNFNRNSNNIYGLWAVSSAAEHRSYTPGAVGSNPTPPTTYIHGKLRVRQGKSIPRSLMEKLSEAFALSGFGFFYSDPVFSK
jgi:hypothetical protein